MTRVIVSTSFEGSGGPQPKIKKTLERHGFSKTSTALHVADLSDPTKAVAAIQDVLEIVELNSNRFDHLWIHISK